MQSLTTPLRLPPTRASNLCLSCLLRHFTQTRALPSGHSKWATIKHDKARADSTRGKTFQAISAEIALASRLSGPDPSFNPRLSETIARAKKAGFPKANIEFAILKGQGKSGSGAALENVTVEGVIPPVAFIVEAVTESKARTLGDVRLVLKRCGGMVSPTAYLFGKKGRMVFERREGVGADQVLEVALEAGALDVYEDENGRVVVESEPAELKSMEKELVEGLKIEGLVLESSDTVWAANGDTMVGEVLEDTRGQCEKLEEDLASIDEVRAVYHNMGANVQTIEATT